LFYISIGLLPIGLLFRIQHFPGGAILFILGLLGLYTYFIARTIKDVVKNRINWLNISLQIIIVLMSPIIYSKYFFHDFGDVPGLLIVPSFVIMSLFYLFIKRLKDNRLIITSITYLMLSIPFFGLEFPYSPKQYIPKDWYDRYDSEKGIAVTLPYGFRYKETEELSIKAFDLKESNHFYEAITLYHQAIKLEPQNPRLFFDISECYARINDLESAIAALDTAISIDSTYAGFYNNRGLLFYKLKENDKAISDYKRAIQLDSTQSSLYENLALAYYNNNLFDKSCEAIEKAEKLGLNIDDSKELKWIKEEKCK